MYKIPQVTDVEFAETIVLARTVQIKAMRRACCTKSQITFDDSSYHSDDINIITWITNIIYDLQSFLSLSNVKREEHDFVIKNCVWIILSIYNYLVAHAICGIKSDWY